MVSFLDILSTRAPTGRRGAVSLRRLLVLIVASLLIACVIWEIYDPPGEEVELLSLTIGEFEVQAPDGIEDLGPCTVQLSAFIDQGRPGLAVKIKLLCTLSRAPPPAVSLIYAFNLSCRIVISFSGSKIAEEELPVGGLVLKAPNAPYQLLDEHDVEAEELSRASGLISLSLEAILFKGDEVLAQGAIERGVLIPPGWALPLTISMACATIFLYLLYTWRTVKKAWG